MSGPSLRPTSPALLLGLVAGGAVVGVLLAALAFADLPALDLRLPVLLGVLAVALAALAVGLRDRMRGLGRPPEPTGVARAAALARAGSATGALSAGFFGGYAARLATRSAEAAAADARVAVLAAAAAAALVAAALLLERVCRLPDGGGRPTP